MENHSMLKASLKELTEAYQQAIRENNLEEAEFWNSVILERVASLNVAIRDSKATGGADSGKL